jgi:hypothetical protein
MTDEIERVIGIGTEKIGDLHIKIEDTVTEELIVMMMTILTPREIGMRMSYRKRIQARREIGQINLPKSLIKMQVSHNKNQWTKMI